MEKLSTAVKKLKSYEIRSCFQVRRDIDTHFPEETTAKLSKFSP